MDRRRFYYLFANAGCLAELGLNEVARTLAELPSQAGAPAAPADDGDLMAGFEDLDFGALDDLPFFGDQTPAAVGEPDAGVPEQSGGAAPAPAPAKFDIDRYLQMAYGYEEQIAGRVDRAFARADLARLETMLGALPDALPPLTGALDGAGMQLWLDRYLADEADIGDLVTEVRRLDN